MRLSHLVLAVGLLAPTVGLAAPVVPDALKPWVDWVLADVPDAPCPASTTGSKVCAFPSTLALSLTDTGGSFALSVQQAAPGWQELPSHGRGWPTTVERNGEKTPVVSMNGVPTVWLEAGTHTLKGTLSWDSLPENLKIPAATGLVDLTVNGRAVAHPMREPLERLWLGTARDKGKPADVQNTLNVLVQRLVDDDLPPKVVTRVRLIVSGVAREEVLSPLLLDGTTATDVGGDLPTQLTADGRLRVQVRPGVYNLWLHARATTPLTALAATPQPYGPEVWVFSPRENLRQVDVTGAQPIDPAQADLPEAWRQLAAWQMTDASGLTFAERSRGAPPSTPNLVSLNREFWVDFDGTGFSVRDSLNGQLQRDWRLNLQDGELGSVMHNGERRYITLDNGKPGVELRDSAFNLVAEGRLTNAPRALLPTTLPIAAWGTDLTSANATLALPPGWRVFAVDGADSAWGTLVSQWDLYDVFFVLIIAVAMGKIWGARWGVFGLVAMGFLFHSDPGIKNLVLSAIALSALARALPEGSFQSWAQRLRIVTLALLALMAIPFLISTVRSVMHPQLESRGFSLPMPGTAGFRGGAPMAEMAFQSAPAEMAAPDMADGASVSENLSSRVYSKARDYAGLEDKRRMAAPPQRRLTDIDPSAVLQTGRGLPTWSWSTVNLSWNSTVSAGTQVQVYLLTPTLWKVWQLLQMGLLVVLFARLALPQLPRLRFGKAAMALLAFLMLAPSAHAQGAFPTPELLNDLRQRLLKAPLCAPSCAALEQAQLVVDGDRLTLTLQASAVEPTVLALPAFAAPWQPARVTRNGADVTALVRQDNRLWMLVPAGVHTVVLDGAMPRQSDAMLSFPAAIPNLTHRVSGWRVERLSEDSALQGGLKLVRTGTTADNAPKEEGYGPSVLVPHATVTRSFDLGLRWQVSTLVTRDAGADLVVRYPLLPGETLMTPGIPTERVGDQVFARFTVPSGQVSVQVESTLNPVETLTLKAPLDANWAETWTVAVSPIWRLTVDGPTPVAHIVGNVWRPEWRPYPGETLTLSVRKPEGAPGQDLTVRSSHLSITATQRAIEHTLNLTLDTSRPRLHSLGLPEGAELRRVTVNDKTLNTDIKNNQINLPLVAGSNTVTVVWADAGELPFSLTTPAVNLGANHSNSTVSLSVPDRRWVVWVSGPRLGPAVLLWSLLAATLVLGALAGRMPLSPLKGWQWALFALGFTQVEPLALLIVAAWLYALAARRAYADRMGRFFNLTQVGLVALTLMSLSLVFMAVKQGLLNLPTLYIDGNGSTDTFLNWYQDLAGPTLPDIWVLTLPLWLYRAIMMVWSLWVAFTLIGLLKWGWSCYCTGGYWRRKSGLTTETK